LSAKARLVPKTKTTQHSIKSGFNALFCLKPYIRIRNQVKNTN